MTMCNMILGFIKALGSSLLLTLFKLFSASKCCCRIPCKYSMYGVFEQNKKQIIKKMLIYVEINLCTTPHVSRVFLWAVRHFAVGFFFSCQCRQSYFRPVLYGPQTAN